MTKRIRAFSAFWYDFLIGDDWLVAAGVVVSLALTYWVSPIVPAWWLMPLFLVLLLPVSLWRAARRR